MILYYLILIQIRDLLKFHKKADEKLKDVKHLTTGQPLQATYSRSFYIVRNDDSKEVIFKT